MAERAVLAEVAGDHRIGRVFELQDELDQLGAGFQQGFGVHGRIVPSGPGRPPRYSEASLVKKMEELAAAHGWFMTRQFENEANPDIHSRTTAREILADFPAGSLDYWITGYGTGGTLRGVSRVLAAESPTTKIIVCEPAEAPLLGSGSDQARHADGTPVGPHPAFNPHPMQGWTPDFIPYVLQEAVDRKLYDELVPVAAGGFPARTA